MTRNGGRHTLQGRRLAEFSSSKRTAKTSASNQNPTFSTESANSGRSTSPPRSSTIVIEFHSNFACQRQAQSGLRSIRMVNRNLHAGWDSACTDEVHRFNSKMLSISTGMPIGNVCTPSALRAGSLLCPNKVSKRSLAPLATCGCWVNDGSPRT